MLDAVKKEMETNLTTAKQIQVQAQNALARYKQRYLILQGKQEALEILLGAQNSPPADQ